MTTSVVRTVVHGGQFEDFRRNRSAEDERYDDGSPALDVTDHWIVTLSGVPGTPLMFEGRNPAHRVSLVGSGLSLCVGPLAFDSMPGHHGQRTALLGPATAAPSKLPLYLQHGPWCERLHCQVGEAFVGSGDEAAHHNTAFVVMGELGGKVSVTALDSLGPGTWRS